MFYVFVEMHESDSICRLCIFSKRFISSKKLIVSTTKFNICRLCWWLVNKCLN